MSIHSPGIVSVYLTETPKAQRESGSVCWKILLYSFAITFSYFLLLLYPIFQTASLVPRSDTLNLPEKYVKCICVCGLLSHLHINFSSKLVFWSHELGPSSPKPVECSFILSALNGSSYTDAIYPNSSNAFKRVENILILRKLFPLNSVESYFNIFFSWKKEPCMMCLIASS